VRPGARAAAGPAGSGLVPRPWRVEDVTPELASTVTLHLRPVDGEPPPFRPGQINMLSVPGLGEVPISVSTDPDRPEVQGHTIRAAGAVTTALVQLSPGATVGVRGPFGTSWDPEDAAGGDALFVAGGIGMAPLRSALIHVLNARDRYRRVVVCSGAGTPTELLYGADLAHSAARGDAEIHLIVERPALSWAGPVGVVSSLLPGLDVDWPGAMAFVCGPDEMMRATATTLTGLGMAAARVRLTLERNMKCAVALCGHCQLGPLLVCRDGPIVAYDRLEPFYAIEEI